MGRMVIQFKMYKKERYCEMNKPNNNNFIVVMIFSFLVAFLFLSFAYGQDQLKLKIICLVNCRSVVEQKTIVTVKCTPICKNATFSWSLVPEPDDFQWDRDAILKGRSLTLKAWTLPKGPINIAASLNGVNTTIQLNYKEIKPSYEITCISNCNNSNPDLETNFSINCPKRCSPRANFTWQLVPPPNDDGFLSFGDKNLTIHKGAYEKSGKVVLVVRDGFKKKTVRLEFVSQKPDIVIECVENCQYDSNRNLTLIVTCKTQCPNTINYYWEIIPKREILESNNTVIIPRNTFLGGEEMTATALLNDSKTSFHIIFNGSCDISPKSGFAGSTKFSVSCAYVGYLTLSVLQKYNMYPNLPGLLLYKGPLTNDSIFLSQGDPANITIDIEPLGKHFNFSLLVRGEPSKEEVIKKKVLLPTGDSLQSFKLNRSFDKIVQVVPVLMDTLDNISDEKVKSHYQRHILNDISEISQQLNPFQLVSLLVKLVSSKASPPTREVTSRLLKEGVAGIEKISQNVSKSDLEAASEEVLIIASSLVNASGDTFNKSSSTHDDFLRYNVATIEVYRHLRRSTYNILTAIENLSKIKDKNGDFVNFPHGLDVVTSTETVTPRSNAVISAEGAKSFVNVSSQIAQEFNSRVLCHVTIFKKNPLWWNENHGKIASELVMVNAYKRSTKITTLTTPIDLYVKVFSTSPTAYNGVLSANVDDKLHVHRNEVESNAYLTFRLKRINEEYYVYISETTPRYEQVIEEGVPVSNEKELVLKWKVITDVVYVSVARIGGIAANYHIEVTATQCLSWHGDTWDWDNTNCQVMDDSDENFTHCRCTRLSLFASSFLVVPNRIDFLTQTTFTQAIIRSSLVLIAVGIILLVWSVLMVLAARKDAQLDKRRFHVLDDNVPGDSYPYLVEVVTGPWRDAGTSARVAIRLVGNGMYSRVHLLQGPRRLNQGNKDVYVLHSPEYLGKMLSIRLFHDSYGPRPHWYCERVTVYYLPTREKYVFIVQKWFSTVYEDGHVVRQILLTDESKMREPGVLFPQYAQNEFHDNHLWLSIFTREPHNNFTCKERIMVAAAVLLLSMTSSAMFFGIADENSMDAGAFDFTATELGILFESLFITVPISVIITLIFRKSRPKKEPWMS